MKRPLDEDGDHWGLFGDEPAVAVEPDDKGKRSQLRLSLLAARAQLIAAVNESAPTIASDLKALEAPWPEAGSLFLEALTFFRQGSSSVALAELVRGLADLSFKELKSRGAWQHPAQRELFCFASAISALTACDEGQAGEASVLRGAMRDVDLAMVLGLPDGVAAPLAAAVEAALDFHGVIERRAGAADDGTRVRWPTVGLEPPMAGPLVTSIAARELSPAAFRDGHFKCSRAVAIRGLAETWPAFSEWSGREGLQRLAAQHGHRTVPLELRDPQGELTEVFMTLREFVEGRLLAAPSANVGTAYLAQHDLFSQIPALRDAIKIPEICEAAASLKTVNMWMGTGGTITRAHYDSYDNVFVQLVGRKYVRLLARDQEEFLYVDQGGGLASQAAQGNMSAVPDLEQVDLERFPLMAKAAFSEVLLEPGDALFIPAGMWHHVRSLSVSVSVSFWF